MIQYRCDTRKERRGSHFFLRYEVGDRRSAADLKAQMAWTPRALLNIDVSDHSLGSGESVMIEREAY